MHKLFIPTDSVDIATSLFQPHDDGKHPIIVYLNGKGGVKERFYTIAEYFQNEGYASLCFDFRGRGGSKTGEVPLFKTQFADFEYVMSYINKLESIDAQNIIVVATSMGGYVAASLVHKYESVKKLFLLEPSLLYKRAEEIPYLDIEADELSIGFDIDEEELKEISSIQGIQRYKGELYITKHSQSSYKDLMEKISTYYYNYASHVIRKKTLTIDASHAIFKTDEGQKEVIKLLRQYL